MANSQYQKKADLIKNKESIKEAENVMKENLEKEATHKEPTSIENFREYFDNLEKGYIIELPHSKLRVTVSPPNLINMFLDGSIPSNLMETALRLKGMAPKKTVENMDMKELKYMAQFMDKFFCDSVIFPTFSEDPQSPDEFPVSKIDFSDKYFIFELINRGVERLEFFRRQSDGATGRSSSKKVRKNT